MTNLQSVRLSEFRKPTSVWDGVLKRNSWSTQNLYFVSIKKNGGDFRCRKKYNQNYGSKGESFVDKSGDFMLKCDLEGQFKAQLSTRLLDSLHFILQAKGQLNLGELTLESFGGN